MATQLTEPESATLALIESIPALAERQWRVAPLSDGLTNDNFLLQASDARLVLRRNLVAAGVDREREARVLQQVAMRGMAPLVVACDPLAGYLVTEFVDEPRWQADDVADAERLTALGKYLRNLHEIPVDDIGALNLSDDLEWYWRQSSICSLPAFERVRGGANNLLAELHDQGWHEQRPAICHHDLNHANIFGDYALTVIDWEYAAVGNPLLDLGMYISYHDLTLDDAAPLVEAYFGAMLPDVVRRLALAGRVAQLLELLWLASRESLPALSRQRLDRLMLVWS